MEKLQLQTVYLLRKRLRWVNQEIAEPTTEMWKLYLKLDWRRKIRKRFLSLQFALRISRMNFWGKKEKRTDEGNWKRQPNLSKSGFRGELK